MINPRPVPPSLSATVAYTLRCVGCGAAPRAAGGDFRCETCRELFEVVYPWSPGGRVQPGLGASWRALWLSRRQSNLPLDQSGVWRFRELLPVLERPLEAVTLREGQTPVYELPRSAVYAGLEQLWAKHQGMNPSASFKDTGMTVALSRAREMGFAWVACASTGNTSAAMAAYAARAGMNSLVLIPDGKIAWGKLAQAIDYGAVTCQLRTDFDGCVRVLNQVITRAPVYLVNSVNPFRVEGQKTAAVELLEQWNWEAPDHIVVPGGNLANGAALGKALLELRELGLISRLPRISVIQAAGANPLVRSLRETGGTRLQPVQAETLASAIRIGNPASWRKAVQVLTATEGACEEVSETEIAEAKAMIGADGIGCEPASAATLAGVVKLRARGWIKPRERVVLILTGHSLKDPEYTLGFHRGELPPGTTPSLDHARRPPLALDAEPDAVLRVLEARQTRP